MGEALVSVCGDQLDLLVNNAGLLAAGPFVDTDLERHRELVDVNVLGTINGAHTALPYLKKAVRPVLLNLGSASAIYGQPDLATYSATKFAVRGLTEALELELGGNMHCRTRSVAAVRQHRDGQRRQYRSNPVVWRATERDRRCRSRGTQRP